MEHTLLRLISLEGLCGVGLREPILRSKPTPLHRLAHSALKVILGIFVPNSTPLTQLELLDHHPKLWLSRVQPTKDLPKVGVLALSASFLFSQLS